MTGKVVQARQAFSVQHNGAPVFVAEGELWDGDDPIVKGREHLFGELSVRSTAGIGRRAAGHGKTETADAAPGEARNVRPAPASPAKAAPAKATKSVKQDPPPSEV